MIIKQIVYFCAEYYNQEIIIQNEELLGASLVAYEIKAIFIDFYDTIVHEDGEVIKKVSQEIFDTGNVKDKAEIGAYWWNEFQGAFLSAYGDNFRTQRELEYQSLANTIHHFESTADAIQLSNMMFGLTAVVEKFRKVLFRLEIY